MGIKTWPRLHLPAANIPQYLSGSTLKINFTITWENFSPASWDENLPCNRDCQASPASQATTSSSLNFASEQNGSPED